MGLLQARYPGDEVANVGLFDLGTYGVPIAFAGMLYVILLSDFLIPGGSKFIGGSSSGDNLTEAPTDIDESILLGARLTKWSAAVNRTVKRSGLHDTAGLYLVNVHRAATGNVHRAVGQDFVLNVGDILYFTGLVEGFGKFCEDNGLEGEMASQNFLFSFLYTDAMCEYLFMNKIILNPLHYYYYSPVTTMVYYTCINSHYK